VEGGEREKEEERGIEEQGGKGKIGRAGRRSRRDKEGEGNITPNVISKTRCL